MSNNKVINFSYKKFQKETGTDHIPTNREVLDKMQEVRDKCDEMDNLICRIIDDIDSIKKSKNKEYDENEYSYSWKIQSLEFRLAIANDTNRLLKIIEEELL